MAREYDSYYFDKHGDVPFRATSSLEAFWQSNHFALDDYIFECPGNELGLQAVE
ncbi:MAG: hypothetical protein ACR2LX_11980 [Jatrophihabitans sp.]